MVPDAPTGCWPSRVPLAAGVLRMFAPLELTRAPTANVPGGGGGGALTVMVAVPLLPLLVAVISDVPAATPVTRPLALTVATDVLADDHVNVWPAMTLPAESFAAAVS